MSYKPIEDYGIIGDLHSVALVGLDGSIDYLCLPELDSPTVFAALLDQRRGGSFRLAPTVRPERQRQFYLPDTNMLLTRFLARDGVAELSDFMPVEQTGQIHDLVRRVKTVRGELDYRMVCEPRFDYGRAAHRVERDGEALLFISDGLTLRLHGSVPLEVEGGVAVAEFRLRSGESAWFVLEEVDDRDRLVDRAFVTEAFKRTAEFWRQWSARSTYRGRWREMVNRSALMLKLLTSQDHGSIAAAATFGLPEAIGGERNWDYRYTWIRDASFTIYAFLRLGLHEEANAFFGWLERICHQCSGPSGPLQVMYGLDGETDLEEHTLDHLEGYRGSRPVRAGNAAFGQLQLDIYGELLDTVYLYDKYGRPIQHDLWGQLEQVVSWVCDSWDQPDEGIWEMRSAKRDLLYSRVMCWVAIDRGLRLARRRSLPAPRERWARERDAIYQQIFEEFWDPERETFVRARGSKALDASTLIMPLVRVISPTDPRWVSTMRAIEQELVEDSMVYRYRADRIADGLSGREGTFSICSFWYVECLSRMGELDRARLVLEKMLAHANHVGLYAEELGPCGEHLGNFPQAFTHLALISAAYDLDRRLSAPPGRFV